MSPIVQCLLVVVVAQMCDAFRFHLPPDTKKCLKEEIHKNVLVTGEFELIAAPGQKTHITVSKVDRVYSKPLLTPVVFD